MSGFISVRKAEEHNLKQVDVDIPRDRLIVVTGPSGSGKSTLVFDTIFAEGQRRYVESLSSYARRFLGRLDKPKVEKITGLPPAISIEQKGRTKNPRSTVGTSTEIHDYLRLLYANIGTPHCVECGRPMEQLTPESAARLLLHDNGGERVQILAPVVRDEAGKHEDVLANLLSSGFARVRVDGEIEDIDGIEIDGRKKHNIEVVVDRVELSQKNRERLIGSLETAIEVGSGIAIATREGMDDLTFADQLMCPYCGVQYEKLGPKAFSYNRPDGMCPECMGLGVTMAINPELVVYDDEVTAWDIAARAFENRKWMMMRIDAIAAEAPYFDPYIPFKDLSKKAQDLFLHGKPEIVITYIAESENSRWEVTRAWTGVIPWLMKVFDTGQKSSKPWHQYRAQQIGEKFATKSACASCNGRKLKPQSLAVTVGGESIDTVSSLTIQSAYDFFENIKLTEREHKIADLVLKEILSRLRFLLSVGLEYLNLDRLSMTLSGGESQRIRLATQIGSALTGVLYCLDEPSIGLHPRDINRLIETFYNLRSLGNTVVVVEHDKDTIEAADHIIDLGPYAGDKQIPVPEKLRDGNGQSLFLRGAEQHNLIGIDVEFPLGQFICVTGVSGSGKSTLLNETLYKALAREINGASKRPGKYKELLGVEHLDRLVLVDQSPIGRTPRSNPATYTKTFSYIRDIFAKMPEAKTRGYAPGRFSFNTREGRCEKCEGSGVIRVEMHFMSDVYIQCDVCKGKRFDRETLEIVYKGKNINEVLSMTIDEALHFFGEIPKIYDKLQTLVDVGLGYLQLGQPATQLSGGEAQRMKLASELSKRGTGNTLYILDEPTTGLGPEGGDKGGRLVGMGTPEQLCDLAESYTGNHLRATLYGPNVKYGDIE
ncbi:MAG: excinuclease ABC subunit UvrA [Candidatus Thorarchaeota archaeon]